MTTAVIAFVPMLGPVVQRAAAIPAAFVVSMAGETTPLPLLTAKATRAPGTGWPSRFVTSRPHRASHAPQVVA